MTNIMWQPSEEQIANSQMTQFIHFVNQRHQLTLQKYDDLYAWSLAHKGNFWLAVWDYTNIRYSVAPTEIYKSGATMIDTQWFTDARFNFAENLLRHNNDKIALVFNNEQNQRQQISYEALHKAVAKLANHFRELGLKPNDCVAALLPNIPESVIAMLATTSIGAIWSSCSPDFGKEALLDRFSQIMPKILLCSHGYFYNGKTFSNFEKIAWLNNNIASLKEIIIIDYGRRPLHHTSEFINELKQQQKPNTSITSYECATHNSSDQIIFEQLPFDHPVYIMYSSGTTGVPKCIVHGAGGTLIQHLKELILHTDLTEYDNIFYYTTCGWMMWNWYITSLSMGATVLQYDGAPFYPTPSRLLDLIDNEKITVFGTSAKYISSLETAGVSGVSTHNLSSLRTILSTGGPLVSHNYNYVYQHIKTDVCLASISGGTDIISCFALGNPILPVYSGELQCIGLGMAVRIFDESGEPIINAKGELVCTEPFPSMPVYFWNDSQNKKYHGTYFAKFPNVWAHGDYAELTDRHTLIIYGRSDATLNPGGVRIGTAEIYRQIETMPEIAEGLAIGLEVDDDVQIILYVILRPGITLGEQQILQIKQSIREHCSPRHVPAKIIAVPDFPRTLNGKVMELAVREIINGRPIKNSASIANPESVKYFVPLK